LHSVTISFTSPYQQPVTAQFDVHNDAQGGVDDDTGEDLPTETIEQRVTAYLRHSREQPPRDAGNSPIVRRQQSQGLAEPTVKQSYFIRQSKLLFWRRAKTLQDGVYYIVNVFSGRRLGLHKGEVYLQAKHVMDEYHLVCVIAIRYNILVDS
jgi:hypothetical protein